jgi:hypothetical protein
MSPDSRTSSKKQKPQSFATINKITKNLMLSTKNLALALSNKSTTIFRILKFYSLAKHKNPSTNKNFNKLLA